MPILWRRCASHRLDVKEGENGSALLRTNQLQPFPGSSHVTDLARQIIHILPFSLEHVVYGSL
jgi:hypothetical protein